MFHGVAYVGEMLFYLCFSSYIKNVNVISYIKFFLLSSGSHVVAYLLLFGQLSPRKKKSFKQVHDGMFNFFPPLACLHILWFIKYVLQLCHVHFENSM